MEHFNTRRYCPSVSCTVHEIKSFLFQQCVHQLKLDLLASFLFSFDLFEHISQNKLQTSAGFKLGLSKQKVSMPTTRPAPSQPPKLIRLCTKSKFQQISRSQLKQSGVIQVFDFDKVNPFSFNAGSCFNMSQTMSQMSDMPKHACMNNVLLCERCRPAAVVAVAG